eukprot:Tamp_20863.p1 GENE.Tamp_20863~~Tamp_20863.p1  ORF type:complete len:202 (+),score=29.96 Tamp_20863:511-1116(+)
MEAQRKVPAVKFIDGSPGNHRTHLAQSLALGETPLVQRIEERLANVTGTSPLHGEPFQVLQYRGGTNDHFRQHRDYLEKEELEQDEDFWFGGGGGNRIVTVILYLRAPELGGETFFNQIAHKMHVDPGDAILVWNVRKDGTNEPLSAHSGLPPTKGDKWVAVKWIRANAMRHTATASSLRFKSHTSQKKGEGKKGEGAASS